ncbi:hypothetical protein [Halobacillus sp. A5]|uniref:hypothetical protein n=1 Tax=Halobacillus sp. A5 TaxID=2880263 RepID=UPI0020A641F1|nr:hypothetical protein [Halobacillus sp. A5]MCP3029125.1 hypothetical protein [Halobacillus sp. A5]
MSACGSGRDEVEIDRDQLADTLYIQKVEDNQTREEQKAARQEEEINDELLNLIEGMEIEKGSENEIRDSMGEQETYTYSFSDEGELAAGADADFSFAVLEDGTFLLPKNGDDSGTISYQSTEKHPELLNKINHTVDISF